jgi:hypothetical protein
MNTSTHKNLSELHDEITLLLKYGAPQDEQDTLAMVIEKYSADMIALNVFHSFYSFLPEGLEDGISKLSRVANRHGVFLLCATASQGNYLYLTSRESATLVATLAEGIIDPDILKFFGWQDHKQFMKVATDPSGFPEHLPLNDSLDLCPICGTGDGETHAPGCSVEICPWCAGQLTNCECRFTRTGREKLSRESHLEEFLKLLEKKGRIPFSAKEHRPSFMQED